MEGGSKMKSNISERLMLCLEIGAGLLLITRVLVDHSVINRICNAGILITGIINCVYFGKKAYDEKHQ